MVSLGFSNGTSLPDIDRYFAVEYGYIDLDAERTDLSAKYYFTKAVRCPQRKDFEKMITNTTLVNFLLLHP